MNSEYSVKSNSVKSVKVVQNSSAGMYSEMKKKNDSHSEDVLGSLV